MTRSLAYSANAYRRFPIEQAIDRIAALGFRGIEIMADDPHLWPMDVTPDRAADVRRRIETAGLTISNINAFMMTKIESFQRPSWIEPDAAYRALRVEHTKRSLTLARQLGARCITTQPGGPLPDDVSWKNAFETFVETLKPVYDHAEREGVMLLVEPEPDLLIENAEQFAALADRIDSPMFGLNYDVGHFYCVADPLGETIRGLAKYIRHFHLEDIAATRVHEHLIPGRGSIDFAEVFAAIRDINYDGWLTIELYPYLDDPDAAGREAGDCLRTFI